MLKENFTWKICNACQNINQGQTNISMFLISCSKFSETNFFESPFELIGIKNSFGFELLEGNKNPLVHMYLEKETRFDLHYQKIWQTKCR